jgi:hypothetical protein
MPLSYDWNGPLPQRVAGRLIEPIAAPKEESKLGISVDAAKMSLLRRSTRTAFCHQYRQPRVPPNHRTPSRKGRLIVQSINCGTDDRCNRVVIFRIVDSPGYRFFLIGGMAL